MRNHHFTLGFLGLGFFLLFGLAFLVQGQSSLSLEEIVEKNIQASGGKENIAKIENFSFRIESSTYYIASDGRMKIVLGEKPIIKEITIVNQKQVKRNSFNEITEILGLERAQLCCLAKLGSGLFTLINFKDGINLEGLKSFGQEKLYCLDTQIENLFTSFFVDAEDFMIKRMVFKSFDAQKGKYEVNYDFGPYQDVNEVKVPSSWFSSSVGARGTLSEISDVKINNSLEKDFFSNLDVNVGEVTVSAGLLKGNVVEFNEVRNNLFITSNWRNGDTEKAGFKTNDRLIFLIDDIETELVFYASSSEVPPRSNFPQGAKIMFLDSRRGNTYLIYFYSTEFTQIADKLKPLLPIQVKKMK